MIRIIRTIRTINTALLAVLAWAVHPAQAAPITNPTPQRSYVSLKGLDSNDCGLLDPCRTWQAALAQTQAGGEILTLDSGGFGLLVITQPVTLVVPPGVYGGASPPAGSAGITINAPGAAVVLKGFTITGQASTALGVDIQAAASVVIQDASIAGTSIGIHAASAGSLQISNTSVQRCTSGVALAPGSGSLTATVLSSNVSNNSGDAFDIDDNVIVDIDASSLSMNGGMAINAVNTTVNTGNSVGMGVLLSNSKVIGNAQGGFSISDQSGVTVANSYVGSGLSHNTFILNGTFCVDVQGSASSWLFGNLMTGCSTGVMVDATAAAYTDNSNQIGSHNKTLVGGTANVALPALPLW